MIIKELEIISFGKFKNKKIKFSEGLNIISGDNESGKSTVINFIYAMLFGFGDNRGKSLSLREKYIPWDSDFCEGKLLITTEEGRNITVYRKSGNAKKYDAVRVYDSDTGEDIMTDPKLFLGVSGETFLKTLCIRQLSTVFDGSNDEIAQRLSNIASGGDENASFEKALKLLENVRREIQPQRGSGGMLSQVSQKISQLEKSRYDAENAAAELSMLSGTISEAKKEKEKIKNEYDSYASDDLDLRLAHIMGRIEEIKKQSILSPFVIRVFMLLSAVITLCLLFIKPLLSVPFAVLTVLFAFTDMRKKRVANAITALLAEKEILESKKAARGKELSNLKEALDRVEEKLSTLLMREMVLKSSLKSTPEGLSGLYREKSILEKKLRTLNCATEALKSAHLKMQKNFTPQLSRKASEYFSIITGGKYSRIFCDEDLGVKIEGSIPRESSFFSGGTVDQLYLSVRLALIDMLFKEKTCPLILDQPFIQYDEDRKTKAVALLEKMPKNRQILLFTSDKNLNSSNKQTEILT